MSTLNHSRYVFLFLLITFLLSACEKDLEDVDELEYDNPFDQDNPATNGDPYNLAAEVTEDEIVLLRWDDIDNVDGVNVYRSTMVYDNYVNIGTSESGEYTDREIQPGVTYYYMLQAYRGDSRAPLSPPTEPLMPKLPLTKISPIDGAEMVLIPAGKFQMGSNDGKDDEKPVHTVYLDAFYMDKHEVTNAQYRRFVQATGHSEPEGYAHAGGGEWRGGFRPWSDSRFNGDSQPVICVSWDDAQAYAKWAGKRLPTEAEWEKAARGGLTGKKYPLGDDIPNDDANYSGTIGKDVWSATAPVGSLDPNDYGLYDVAGNVWEWCADWYDSSYYSISPERNPTGPNTGVVRVLRGGCWYNGPVNLRVAFRLDGNPTNSSYDIGFRCGMSQSD